MKPLAVAALVAASLITPIAAVAQTPPAAPDQGSAPTPAPAAPTAPSPGPAPTPAAPTQPAPPVTTAPAPSPSAANPTSPPVPSTSTAQPAAPTRQMPVSALTEKDLVGNNNDEVGDIERVVESNADKKQHLVISRGGFLGLFETEVLIPLENVAVKGDQIVLRNLSQDQIRALPKFDSNDAAHRRLEDNQSVTLAEQR